MDKNLIIVGAGGLGRIVHDVIYNDSTIKNEYNLPGFLDNRIDFKLPDSLDASIIGSPLDYSPRENDYFIPAIGDPKLRKLLLGPLIAKGAKFYSYIHNAHISSRCTIGNGVFLTPGVTISTDCSIGDFNYIDTHVIIGHDVKIEDFCTIGAKTFIAGNVLISTETAIHPCSVISKSVKIGTCSTIGIGSVVIKDVEDRSTVFGNPAKKIFN